MRLNPPLVLLFHVPNRFYIQTPKYFSSLSKTAKEVLHSFTLRCHSSSSAHIDTKPLCVFPSPQGLRFVIYFSPIVLKRMAESLGKVSSTIHFCTMPGFFHLCHKLCNSWLPHKRALTSYCCEHGRGGDGHKSKQQRLNWSSWADHSYIDLPITVTSVLLFGWGFILLVVTSLW